MLGSKKVLNKNEIKILLEKKVLPKVFEAVPQAKSEALIFLYGSYALNLQAQDSDIDLAIFLPQKVLTLTIDKLNSLKVELWKKFSLDMTFTTPLERLYLDNFWNQDFLLYILTQAKVVHDPKHLLVERKTFFSKMPKSVKSQKIIFVTAEIIQTLTRLSRALNKPDQLAVVGYRQKLIKLNLVILNLLHNDFFDSHNLYFDLLKDKRLKNFQESVKLCVKTINNSKFEANLTKLVKDIQEEAEKFGFPGASFYKGFSLPIQNSKYTVQIQNL